MTCQHENVTETTQLTVRWGWTRQDDGHYEPDPTYDKALHEQQIDGWECDECGAAVNLNDDAEPDDDEYDDEEDS